MLNRQQLPSDSNFWITLAYGSYTDIIIYTGKVLLSILFAVAIDTESKILFYITSILFVFSCFVYFALSSYLLYFIYLNKTSIWFYTDPPRSIFSLYLLNDNYSKNEAKLVFLQSILTTITFFILCIDLTLLLLNSSNLTISLLVVIPIFLAIILDIIRWCFRLCRCIAQETKFECFTIWSFIGRLFTICCVSSIFTIYLIQRLELLDNYNYNSNEQELYEFYLFRLPLILLLVYVEFISSGLILMIVFDPRVYTIGNGIDIVAGGIFGCLICLSYIPALILWILYECGYNSVNYVSYVLIPVWTLWIGFSFCCCGCSRYKKDFCNDYASVTQRLSSKGVGRYIVVSTIGDYNSDSNIIDKAISTGRDLICELNEEISKKRDNELFDSVEYIDNNGNKKTKLKHKKVSLMMDDDSDSRSPQSMASHAIEMEPLMHNYRLRSKDLMQEIISPNHVSLDKESYRYYTSQLRDLHPDRFK